MDSEYYPELVQKLCNLPQETEWVEFKRNNSDPLRIGELISALSNSAHLSQKEYGWLVWGIEDKSHQIVGTTFVPEKEHKGQEPLVNWLQRLLSPKIPIEFIPCKVSNNDIVILKIPAAQNQPTRFRGKASIRIGSSCKSLNDYPEHERKLWLGFEKKPFEKRPAVIGLRPKEVINLLDCDSFFELLCEPKPSDLDSVLAKLRHEDFLKEDDAGRWSITNLGAILFAKDLNNFQELKRKPLRLIQYNGNDRTVPQPYRFEYCNGYAVSFSELIKKLETLIPPREIIRQGLRSKIPVYPKFVIRELIANAMIHQDFFDTKTVLHFEVFDNRIEITNPGKPLVEISKLLNVPPKTRNEAMSAFMRRIGVCEEAGTGIDKVVQETEKFRLPPPLWEIHEDAFRVKIFAFQDFKPKNFTDNIRACYLHSCLKFSKGEAMTNTSLRKRFGIEEKNRSQVSRVIKNALSKDLIKPKSTSKGKRYAQYLPYWAPLDELPEYFP
ncbi:MAG: putative DNA binding domain-containing protein [Rhodobacteraceae bacterium]|nr:putative DNA binding domain-containing protein [Paracoccaceae bacterium]